ncbi:MAG TPA: hypothetical protein VKY57_16350, partial [Chitinispirillaceae bacterium]|nr:hypothetical protein [Chitinispirillaceae bacterium]
NNPEDFMIVKPLKRSSVYLDLQWGSHQIPLMLPKEFFTFNDSIEIFTGNWKPSAVSSIPVIDPGPAIEEDLPSNLDNSIVITEVPSDVVENSDLVEGTYNLEDVYDKKDFLKSLSNNAIGGGIGGVVNNFDLLKDFFPGQKFYLKKYNGKYFVVFKGIAGTRTTFKGTKYVLKNPKVMALSAAKSPAAGTGAALKGLKPALKGNIITVIVIGVVDLVAWHNGMLSDDGKFISDFIVEFGMDITKTAVSTITAGFIVGLSCVFAMIAGVPALPVVVVVGAGIVLSVIVGLTLDYLDDKRGYTIKLRNKGNEIENSIANAINNNIVQPICQTLFQLERHIESLYLRQFNISGF